jgi:signal transduction histidine kinase
MLLGAALVEGGEAVLGAAGLAQGAGRLSGAAGMLSIAAVLIAVLLAGRAQVRAEPAAAFNAGARVVGSRSDTTTLTQAEARLRDAINSIGGGFALFDQDDRLVIYNEQYLAGCSLEGRTDLIGTSMEQLQRLFIEVGVIDVKGRDDPEAWLRRRMAQHASPSLDPYEQDLGDGRWMSVSERVTSDGGRVTIWTDISALKAAEAVLKDAVESMNEGFILFDSDMRVVASNERMNALYPELAPLLRPGTRRQDILQFGAIRGIYRGVETPEQINDFVVHRMGASAADDSTHGERELTDGRWVRLSHRRTADGGLVGIHADITREKRDQIELRYAKEQLELQAKELAALALDLHTAKAASDEANQSKSRFLANMSHELRTPLNAVIGFSDMIREEIYGPITPVRYQEYIKSIHESGQHLLSLISDVLDLSKIEAGKIDLRIEPLSVQALADHAQNMMAGIAAKQQVALKATITEGCPDIHADERAIRQILLNLLSNAIKCTPAGGTVSLRFASRETTGVEVAVSDTGIGMTPEEISVALQPYGQIRSELRSAYQGTGLGLPLSKALAEQHGGSLSVTSLKGSGTTVTVFLPHHRR